MNACLALNKIRVSDGEILALQQHVKYKELKSFGVLDLDDSQSIDQTCFSERAG